MIYNSWPNKLIIKNLKLKFDLNAYCVNIIMHKTQENPRKPLKTPKKS